MIDLNESGPKKAVWMYAAGPALALATALLLGTHAHAQQLVTVAATSPATAPAPLAMANGNAAPATDVSSSTAGDLPEAPSALRSEPLHASFAAMDQAPGSHVAPIHMKYIPAGWTAQPLTAHDKVIIGLKDAISPMDLLAIFASAGYEQATNGQPNFGTDRGAFGQRLGAAAIREGTQGLFTDAVFAPMLHQDSRYYVMGPGHNFFHRALYAATRPLITRTDSGRTTVNGALLLGYASSAALSYTYYPPINQNAHDVLSTFGGSIGGAALGFGVSEFSSQLLEAIHLKKHD